MKLKKIASLMLAGIMAVSMLTACDTTNAGDDTVVPPAEDTTPAGYSATILNGTGSNTKSLMTSEDSAMLENAVKAAASSIVSMDEIHDMLHMSEYDAKNAVYYKRNMTTHKVIDGFKDNLAEDVIYEHNEMCNGFWGMPVEKSGTQRYVGLYVYNRALNDTQVNNDVAGIVDTIMGNEKDHVNATEIDYTLSVAKADVGTEANGVVLVGIMITRSFTHAA